MRWRGRRSWLGRESPREGAVGHRRGPEGSKPIRFFDASGEANLRGEIGDGTTVLRNAPVQISALSDIVAVAAGQFHSVALQSNGTVWAWGDNTHGEIGDGSTTQQSTPVPVAALGSAIAVAAGGYHTVAVKPNGTVWGWGENDHGQIGDDTTADRHIPVQVIGLRLW